MVPEPLFLKQNLTKLIAVPNCPFRGVISQVDIKGHFFLLYFLKLDIHKIRFVVAEYGRLCVPYRFTETYTLEIELYVLIEKNCLL